MNQVKPYMFWIVCGVLLIVEIVAMLLIEPSLDEKPTLTPEQSKRDLDTLVDGPLASLHARALNTLKLVGHATRVCQAEDDKDRDDLLKTYLICGKDWEDGLKRPTDDYGRQAQAMADDLRQRSATLHQPVSTADAPDKWEDDYRRRAGVLLKELIDAACLASPRLGTPRDARELADDLELRLQVGLYAHKEVPPVKDHGLLTLRFNAARLIAGILVATRGVTQRNPGFPEPGIAAPPEEGQRAALLSLRWGPSDRSLPGLPATAVAHRLTMQLEGTLAAVLAVTAALDNLSSPVVVRHRAAWQRTQTLLPERYDMAMHMECDLMILDFAAPAAESGGGP